MTIYTQKRTRLTKTDAENFNAQYPTLEVKYTKAFHDRFLILDRKTAYHVGASLKDAGRNAFESVVPAYHMNKTHWNSIILDGSVTDKDIRRMIRESYDMTKGKKKRIYHTQRHLKVKNKTYSHKKDKKGFK